MYLEEFDWSFISDSMHRMEYLDNIIDYGFYFTVFHEYAHIFCGHIDAELEDYIDKKAQECEADMGHANIAVTMEVYNHITEYARIEKEILKMEDLMVV